MAYELDEEGKAKTQSLLDECAPVKNGSNDVNDNIDVQEVVDFEFPSLTLEYREHIRHTMCEWATPANPEKETPSQEFFGVKAQIDIELDDPLYEFVIEILRICAKRKINCIINQFRCDDLHDLWEMESSSESDTDDDDSENEYQGMVWRGKISLSKGEHKAVGIIRHCNMPTMGLTCNTDIALGRLCTRSLDDNPVKAGKWISLCRYNLREFLDKFADLSGKHDKPQKEATISIRAYSSPPERGSMPWDGKIGDMNEEALKENMKAVRDFLSGNRGIFSPAYSSYCHERWLKLEGALIMLYWDVIAQSNALKNQSEASVKL